MKRLFLLLAAIGIGATGALAHDYTAGSLEIQHPWSRATPPNAPVALAYMTITNTGTAPDRLIGGSAPFAGAVEIHETRMEDDVMRMREVAGGLEIAPGETVSLEPGGLHVMFLDLKEPLEKGTLAPVTLEFANAGPIEVKLAVKSMGADGHDHETMDHSSMDHSESKAE